VSTTVDWIWLSLALGIASPAAQTVLTRELDPQELARMSLQELVQAEWFSPPLCKKLKANQQTLFQKAQKILEHCRTKGYQVITARDSAYPLQLLSLQEPPLVLYALGNTEILGRLHDLPVLTVVGTRNASDYGRQAAADLSGSLAKSGMIIVSGLAVGIDACAHTAALKAGKPTIAVLGCGLDVQYPAANQTLRQRMLERGGTLLTELEPSAAPSGGYFPARNRLLAGIGQGVLVVQAPARSGALITANHALEQGKDVFAVPSHIYDPKAGGTLALLRDGAIPAINALDVLYPYFSRFSGCISTRDLQSAARTVRERPTPPPRKDTPPPPAQQPNRRPPEQTAPVPKQEEPKEAVPDFIRGIQPQERENYTRQLPQEVLDEEWREQKKRLLAEILQNTQANSNPTHREKEPPAVQTDCRKSQPSKPKQERQPPTGFSAEQLPEQHQKVYAALTSQPQGLPELAQKCDMSVGELTAVLFEIGVPDPVKVYPGRLFGLSNND
jgi:DNA processing protein